MIYVVMLSLLLPSCRTKRSVVDESQTVTHQQMSMLSESNQAQLRTEDVEQLSVEWWGDQSAPESINMQAPKMESGGYKIRLERRSSEDQSRQNLQESTREDLSSSADSLRTEEYRKTGITSPLLWLLIGFVLCIITFIGVTLRKSPSK